VPIWVLTHVATDGSVCLTSLQSRDVRHGPTGMACPRSTCLLRGASPSGASGRREAVWQDRGPPAFRVGRWEPMPTTRRPAEPDCRNIATVEHLDHWRTLWITPEGGIRSATADFPTGGTGGGRYLNTTGPLPFRVERLRVRPTKPLRTGDLCGADERGRPGGLGSSRLGDKLLQLHMVVGGEHLSRLLADHDRGRVGVAAYHVGHDARVGDPQIGDADHP
jgi:hypothetical protein